MLRQDSHSLGKKGDLSRKSKMHSEIWEMQAIAAIWINSDHDIIIKLIKTKEATIQTQKNMKRFVNNNNKKS